MANDNKWDKPSAPPPKMFFNNKERDLVRQVNTELLERVIGEEIVYYPVDVEKTNFHPLYGESFLKTFLAPIHVYALIDWEGSETETTNYGIDRRQSITVHFHKRRLEEDQDLNVKVGDFVFYGSSYYEIVQLNSPREIFGYANHHMEISAKCIKAREGTFNAE